MFLVDSEGMGIRGEAFDFITTSPPAVIAKVKFIYSEKAKMFCEISTLLLSYVVPVKSEVMISQHFVALSEYMNFYQKRISYSKVLI